MSDERLALALAVTIRHDGHGGVADDLAAPEGLTAWVRELAEPLRDVLDARAFTADGEALGAVRDLRAAVRALFARAVRPGPPSSADAHRLLPGDLAVERLNAAVARVPGTPRLEWPEDGAPVVRAARPAGFTDTDRLVAALARDAIGFLAGPDRERLRACPAPRCVRYFVKDHPRQEWCKPSCGNRARVARHHRRHRAES
ncbi:MULTISPECIES: ABATE domain-containing protein [Streptomyces]|uniref:ABATE domain-containing protein n=1 Tax=Streptomyces lonegramiae TaxID=3075524 RepID=A0ABU2XB07_9ACTN|nr:ABATE domain-containing protein [Streptomyces sp. DSM 41529]MDT0542730.1 ABATE domain-containing protein [Streptomyces sp. DSM 41529]